VAAIYLHFRTPLLRHDAGLKIFRIMGTVQLAIKPIGVTPPFVKNCTLSREFESNTLPELL
jgi:hypothetical protein